VGTTSAGRGAEAGRRIWRRRRTAPWLPRLPLVRSAPLAWPVVFIAYWALHAPLLNLPYYWDEGGYFVPAALDLLRRGRWVPVSTLPNGHPPLVFASLALAWRVAGFHPLVTRTVMILWAGILLAGVYRLAAMAFDRGVALTAATLLALSPIFFAQASLVQLDIPAGACLIWALVARYRRPAVGRPWLESGATPAVPPSIAPLSATRLKSRYAVLIAAACVAKETAIVFPFVLAIADAARVAFPRRGIADSQTASNAVLSNSLRRRSARMFSVLWPHAPAAAALAAWFWYTRHVTGYWMGNPGYVAYNLSTTLAPARMAMAAILRLWQLAGYQGMGLITLFGAWGWARRARVRAALPARALVREVAWLIVASLLLHAVAGGAVLARYLLPALALYIMLAAAGIGRLPRAWLAAGACAVLLLANWFWNPPYPFPYEDNLAYATFVRLHERAALELERRAAHNELQGPILTAWPATGELTNPDLGYVAHPLSVAPVDNFTAAGIAAPPEFGIAYLFSLEYQPTVDASHLLPFWQRWKERHFGHRPPLSAPELELRLHLVPVFYRSRRGQWIELARPRRIGREHAR
jgi:4-amino-4-deoxy-L-arabinose transferase-like glycosyltransferase